MDKNLSPDLTLEEVFSIWHATRGAYLISGKPYVLALTYDAKRAGFAAAFNHPKLAEYRPLIEARSIDDAFEDLAQTFQLSKNLDIAFSSCAYRFYLRTFPLTALIVAMGVLWEPGFMILRTLRPSLWESDLVQEIYGDGVVYLIFLCWWLFCVEKAYKDQVKLGRFTGDEASPLSAIAQARRSWCRWPGWKRRAALWRFNWLWIITLALAFCNLVLLVAMHRSESRKGEPMKTEKWIWYAQRILLFLRPLMQTFFYKQDLQDRERAVE